MNSETLSNFAGHSLMTSGYYKSCILKGFNIASPLFIRRQINFQKVKYMRVSWLFKKLLEKNKRGVVKTRSVSLNFSLLAVSSSAFVVLFRKYFNESSGRSSFQIALWSRLRVSKTFFLFSDFPFLTSAKSSLICIGVTYLFFLQNQFCL